MSSTDQRVCVVTGGNAGIGKHTCIGMAKAGYQVALVARNEEKGRAAVAEVISASGSQAVELVVGDLRCVATTNALADALLAKYPTIDVLINNAGVWITQRRENEDGYEQTFATNHLAPFLLTHRLLDAVKASSAGRIVNLTSALHRRGVIDFDDLHTVSRAYSGIQAYSDSKLMNIMFTRSLARRLADTSLTVNAVHPGRVKTEITTKASGFIGTLARVLTPLATPFIKTAAQGAETSLHVALSGEGGEVSGLYFADSAQLAPKPRALDDVVAERLWSVSMELVGLA